MPLGDEQTGKQNERVRISFEIDEQHARSLVMALRHTRGGISGITIELVTNLVETEVEVVDNKAYNPILVESIDLPQIGQVNAITTKSLVEFAGKEREVAADRIARAVFTPKAFIADRFPDGLYFLSDRPVAICPDALPNIVDILEANRLALEGLGLAEGIAVLREASDHLYLET